MTHSKLFRSGDSLFVAIWTCMVALGMGLMAVYATSPSAGGTPTDDWPADSAIARQQRGPTLVMIVHPRCACTRASLEELAVILSRTGGRLRPYILFLHPRGEASQWRDTDLWRTATRLPGVTVRVDENGREARRFGAATSGHVLLYSAAGRLLFSGGITAQRGHVGANSGRQAILSLVNSDSIQRHATPIFGCPVTEPGKRA